MKACIVKIFHELEDSRANREHSQRVAHREAENAHKAAMRLSAALKNGHHVDELDKPVDPIRPRHPEAP